MGIRTSIAFLASGLTMLASLGCSSKGNPTNDAPANRTVAARQGALTPGWTPHAFDSWTQGWYTAVAGVTTDSSGNVATWLDQTSHHRDLTQTFTPGRPHYNANGWGTALPTVTFNGSQLLSNQSWSSVPSGTETEFTILAVIRSAAAQDASVAAFWDPNGQGYALAGLRKAGTMSLLDMWRVFSLSPGQAYAGSQDLGTTAHHVVAWRYQPSTGVMTQVLDGVSTSSASMPAIGVLRAMPLVVGARSLLPTGLFQGDIAELMIISHALTDADIQNYMDYSRAAWHITTAPLTGGPCHDANNLPAPDTTRCDDGNAQTYADHCWRGVCVGSVPPSGSPANLTPLAWYHANPQEVVISDGGVSTWFDRTQNHLDLMQAFYSGRPTLVSSWPGSKPALHFNGNDGLRRDAWSAAPTGNNQPFTVLAVVRQGVAGQNAAIAAWWNAGGAGRTSCSLKTLNGDSMPDLLRTDESGRSQELPDAVTLGTAPHALIWRYTPNTMTVTVDGHSVPSSGLGNIGAINPDTFLVGMSSYLPTGLFNGDVAEVSVVPRSISDAEVAAFDNYVAIEWGGSLCTCGAHQHCVQGATSGAVACACDLGWGGTNCTQAPGSIAGQATYQGAPLANAVVTLRALNSTVPIDLSNLTATTDAQGNYQISGVPAGLTYQVSARLAGTTALISTGTATVRQNQIFSVSFSMTSDMCNVQGTPTLMDQVNCCKQRLNVTQMPPAGSCLGANTLRFTANGTANMRLGYVKLSDDVDALFHCGSVDEPNQQRLGALEMSIHSRSTGATCMMAAVDGGSQNGHAPPVAFPSLDDDAAAAGANATGFWQFNVQAGSSPARCVDCHRFGGPYVADDAAETMQAFGMFNNGHDTFQSRFNVVDASFGFETALNDEIIGADVPGPPNWGLAGHEFKDTDSRTGNVGDTCAAGCHVFFQFPSGSTFSLAGEGNRLVNSGAMRPSSVTSPYRWMNHNPATSIGDSELLADEQRDYPNISCQQPVRVEAHAVGSPEIVFKSDDLPDRLRMFNLRDGLVCLNTDQPPGHTCHDYMTRYLCVYPTVTGDPFQMPNTNYFWTQWHSNTLFPDGDHEERFHYTGLCATSGGIGEAYALQVQTTGTDANGAPTTWTGYAPNDQLATFDKSIGLICNNVDQGSSERTCSNYVVRFDCQ